MGVFVNSEGKVLVGKRSDTSQEQWQFPQGGINDGETPEQAIIREMQEEVGTSNFTILSKTATTISYDFPQNLNAKIARDYRGQMHYWFLLKFNHELHDGPNLAIANGEFVEFKWVDIKDIINQIIDWKREAYIQGLQVLGLL